MLYVITKNHIPGFHYWKDAPRETNYLKNKHRHIFNITCKFLVSHEDREIELISMQEKIYAYLMEKYGDKNGNIDINDMSCETLAKEIADKFFAFEVIVEEDGDGGAGYCNGKI